VDVPRVLVVEDDATIGRGLAAAIAAEGYDVEWKPNGTDALAALTAAEVALIVLDLGLPDIDGLELCRRFRSLAPEVRIVVLTARTDEIDVVVGLDAGADDYVTKPFRLAELLARVRAHLRRPLVQTRGTIEAGDVVVDVDGRRVVAAGAEVELRPKEFDLLALLASEAGRVVTRERIMSEIWDEHWFGSTKTLDMHISALRRKLGDAQARIVTLRHVGYRFDP
jgi:DNA-binding response OmpR family regulator